uniref:Reverse transcriptase (RNA-dependent DNA polymerase) n=1 Tax=Candidatus Kentrum sp. LFY TaxID=2126342 RepID=A0A450UZ65_9GAMM|nr:MAG: hypothetical protein BECKLFY1418B_GA0070995_11073 [Candidatus Kentron sp. LFY]
MRIYSGFGQAQLLWRNCHMALERMSDLWQQGHNVVPNADIQGFFDNIPHSVMMTGLAKVVADGATRCPKRARQ